MRLLAFADVLTQQANAPILWLLTGVAVDEETTSVRQFEAVPVPPSDRVPRS
jgi:hypothetical protein